SRRRRSHRRPRASSPAIIIAGRESMGTSTSILIRVQARGGKFLGPDIGYSFITVCDVASGQLLAQSVGAGDSGQLGTTLVPNASTGVVFSAPETPNWLAATAGSPLPTAGF